MLSKEEAVQAICSGQLIVYPTETFYALGCAVNNAEALEKLFEVKKRDKEKALPVVIGAEQQLSQLTECISPLSLQLMQHFWPASLSILFPVRKDLPVLLSAQSGFVAVRYTPHSAVQELCMLSGSALVATSANISSHAAVSQASLLDSQLLQQVAGLYVAYPEPQGSLASTLLKVESFQGKEVIRIIREGQVSCEEIVSQGFPLLSD